MPGVSASISPASRALFSSLSLLNSPLLFYFEHTTYPTPSNVRRHGYTRLCFLGVVQPAWKGPEAEGEGEEPVVNQNRRSSESPSHLFESVRGPVRGFVPSVHTSIFFRFLARNKHRAGRFGHRSSIHDDDEDTRCGQSGLTTEVSRFRVAKTGRRTLSHTATFLRDIVPKNRYRTGTKFRDAIMRRRIIGSMDGYRRYL